MAKSFSGFTVIALEALVLTSCVGHSDPLALGYEFDLETHAVELAYRLPRKTFSLNEDIPIKVSFGHSEGANFLPTMVQARLFLEWKPGGNVDSESKIYDLSIIPIEEFKTDKYVYRNNRIDGKTFTYTGDFVIPQWILQEEYKQDSFVHLQLVLFLECQDWDDQGNPIGDLLMSGFASENVNFKYIDEDTVEYWR